MREFEKLEEKHHACGASVTNQEAARLTDTVVFLSYLTPSCTSNSFLLTQFCICLIHHPFNLRGLIAAIFDLV